MFSFVQIRGSIPLKWSQSPYSMKPPPVLDRPVDQSYSVANLHFNDLTKKYGPIVSSLLIRAVLRRLITRQSSICQNNRARKRP
jgi:hypothetical protein